MDYIVMGLGNPGAEYERTRHSAGRIALLFLRERKKFSEWVNSKPYKALVSKGEVAGHAVALVTSLSFMNLSGKSVAVLVGKKKKLERLIVVYDDIDIPIGSLKISFGRGHGGHNGLLSVIKSVKSKDFIRIRIGVCPVSAGGKMKKPKGADAVLKFLLSDFTSGERKKVEEVALRAFSAIETIVSEGKEKAMTVFN